MYEGFEFLINENDSEEGVIFGYISDNDENFINFLEKNDYYEEEFTSLEKYKNCLKGYISNMYVEEEYRNNKHGITLLENMLQEFYATDDLKYVFLICDNIEHNEFSLQKWYEGYGFKVIADKFRCPLMVKDLKDPDDF